MDTILGANAHTTVYMAPTQITNEYTDDVYVVPGKIENYQDAPRGWRQVPGVTRTAALVKGQVMASANDSANAGRGVRRLGR